MVYEISALCVCVPARIPGKPSGNLTSISEALYEPYVIILVGYP
jgi:hypothetical protein